MRAVGVVVVDSTSEHDPGLGERVELLAVEQLASCAGFERLDDPVLPGAAGGDGDGLDAVGGHELLDGFGDELLDGFGDELRAVVGPDVLGPGLLADHGEIITFLVQHRAF